MRQIFSDPTEFGKVVVLEYKKRQHCILLEMKKTYIIIIDNEITKERENLTLIHTQR